MNDDVLEVYVEETRRLGERIDSEIKGVARLASASVALLAVGTVLRLDAHQRRAGLILAPFALVMVFGYAVRRFVEIDALGGYKGYLEGRINRRIRERHRLDEDLMFWDSKLASELFRNARSDLLLWVSYGFVLVSSIVLGVREMWSYRGTLQELVWALPIVLLGLAALLLAAANEYRSARSRAAALAERFGNADDGGAE